MQLLMTWPDNQPAFALGERYTKERAACFNPQTGVFSDVGPSGGVVWFYTTAGGPVIFNDCVNLLCVVDDNLVVPGERYALRLNAAIQIGHYAFTINADDEAADKDEILYSLLEAHATEEKANLVIPEVETILPNGGHHTGDYRYFNDAVSTVAETDILKKLEAEYKKFLIWGEQNRTFVSEQPTAVRLPDCDDYFDAVREEMKAKTLTECIIQAPSLIDKVWEELNVEGVSEALIFDEEKTDILKLLAPENIASKEKKAVPELVYQDLYKPGLDSPY
ncbi:TagK domain-containing protein [Kalamiella sp. sgz302252]|uniref:TagK domain-containing protein n=1 Tax=Pantoea sp. sgz302252 TaxID=3341827 RepID=UPI0036D29D58